LLNHLVVGMKHKEPGLRAESECVVRIETRGASPERRSAALVECVSVSVGAISFEVRVKLDAGRRASRGRIKLAGAAIRRVCLVSIEVGITGALASERETRAVERALQLRRTVWSEVNWAVRHRTVDIV